MRNIRQDRGIQNTNPTPDTRPDPGYSRGKFRSVEEWKSALMTLPDTSFFELLRSVFGNIKTPFNKQKLLDNLFVFLSRDDIRRVIAAYINEQDRKIISAIALLDEPLPARLERFFAGELSYAELHAAVINLEERLILYRFRSEGILRLALNPVLEQVLAPIIADTGILFPSFPTESGVPTESSAPTESGVPMESGAPAKSRTAPESSIPGLCIADSRILAALSAFIPGQEEIFKGEGTAELIGAEIRKKVLDEGKKIFPALDLELAVRTLVRLGLFQPEGNSLAPCRGKITDFSSLSADERNEYWAAGLYLCQHESGKDEDFSSSGLSFRNRLREAALFIHRLAASVEPGRKYPGSTLRRMADLITEEEAGTGNAGLLNTDAPLSFEPALAVMNQAGILEKEGSCWKRRNAGESKNGSGAEETTGGEQEAAPVIAMNSAFSFILYPEISFADAMTLGAFCSVKESGVSGRSSAPGGLRHQNEAVFCFDLGRDSVIRGFDQGMDAETMIQLLNRLSHNRIDESLDWTLREWERRYAGVALHQGVVLTLSEEHRYLANAGPLASMIRRTLAPGVYLLSAAERSEAARALGKAGVDIIARPPPGQDKWTGFSGRNFSLRNYFPSLGFSGRHAREAAPAGSSSSGDALLSAEGASAASIQEKFRTALKKMELTKQERDELAARIERRMVLSETQLDKTSLRYEKLEARGLDYSGKSLIAKQAAETGALVEVSWPGPGGEIQRTLGRAQGLEKKEGESILVVKNSDNSAVLFRIPLGKISLLRRIKQSIFGE